MEEMLKILNEVDILSIFVSLSWFGFEFWFWIFWIYAIMLLILCLCLNGFVFLSLFFCLSELVLLCSLNGFSVRFGLVLLNKRRFVGLCSYIFEHVEFDFEISWCVCIVSMLCLIFNFLGLCLILNFLGLFVLWVCCVWFRIF